MSAAGEPPSIDSLGKLKAWLHEEHGVAIGDDDPVLLVHSIHRAALADHQRMLERHSAALAESIGMALKETEADLEGLGELASRIEAAYRRQLRRIVLLSICNLAMFGVCLVVGVSLFVS